MTTPSAPGHTSPMGPGSDSVAATSRGHGIELFPINFTAYRHHDDLDTEQHVQAIADLLAPYGVRTAEWAVSAEDRDRQGAESRLADWAGGSVSRSGNTVLYWVGHGSARHLAHHETPTPIAYGVTPHDIAQAIGDRQRHPGNDGSWAIVVLDACFSKSFAREVHKELFTHYDDAARYLLLSTAAEGYTELGVFTEALRRVLHATFPTQRAIGLLTLGRALAGRLRGFVDDLTIDDDRDQLVRLTPTAAAAVSAPLDQLAELQAIIDQLPADEQRHFLPKASGAELGELAWYFHGRTIQRDKILRWLTTATSGVLVVTGPAGAGKSALLGHVLLHTNTRLRDILIRHAHLTAVPPGIPCPENPFDLTAHLAGLTLARVLHLVADAAGLTSLARAATDGQSPADLTARLLTALRDRQEPLTLLFDALDEAEQPLVIADQLLHPLAALPGVRLIVGTRRSTREGPDQPTPDDTDLLDTLRPRTSTSHGPFTDGPQDVEVTRDPEAIALYLSAKLRTAKERGALDADDTLIAEAVRRLVTDQRQDAAEPQQFLYARLAAHELLNDPALLADPTPLVGRTHRELFTRALERLHRTDPHYTPLIRALGLAQGRGLPDQDDIWATASDALAPGSARTRDSIPALLRDAAPYLALDHEHGQSVYRLAHRTFTEHFTTAPAIPHAHAAITTALARHTRHTLQQQGTPGATLQAEDVSPYTHHHLAAHARLGHTAAALLALADHPDVLDTLSLTSITTNALHHDLDPNALPPAIAGTVLFQHHARESNSDHGPRDATAWRRWWRRLGTTYIQGTPPPFEPHPHNSALWPPAIVSGSVRRRQLHLQLSGHRGPVSVVAVFTAPDGTPRLATGGDDGRVRIWNPTTGTQEGQPLTGHDGGVRSIAVFTAPDGTRRLATGGDDGRVRIWNPTTGIQEGEPLTGHDDWVKVMVVFAAPDGTPRIAASGGIARSVRIWNPATHAQEGELLTGHDGGVDAMVVFAAPDNTPRLAIATGDGAVRIWNPATGTQEGEPLTGRRDDANMMAVYTAPDGTPRLATATAGTTPGTDVAMRIWDPATGTKESEFSTSHTDGVRSVAVFTAPDGTPRIASAGNDQMVRIWNPATNAQEGEFFTSHTGGVRSVAVFTAPDGTPRIATAAGDEVVRIWNPATNSSEGQPLSARSVGENTAAVFIARDGTLRRALTDGSKEGRDWDPASSARKGMFFTGPDDWVDAMLAFAAPDGSPRLAIATGDGAVQVWNPATGTREGETLTGPGGRVHAVAVFIAPDGTPRIATVASDEVVRVWNPASDELVRVWNPTTDAQKYEVSTGHVRSLVVFTAPDGTPRLAAIGSQQTTVWNPATGAREHLFSTNHERPLVVFTAPDGTPRIATIGWNRAVWIWNLTTGTREGEPLTGHTRRVNGLAVFTAPDGTPRLATGGDDSTVRIWNPTTGTPEGKPLIGHTNWVRSVVVFAAPDGTPRIASASRDQTVRIWNPRTRTGYVLPLTDNVHDLKVGHGLLLARTSSGYLVIDVSSVPTDAA